MRRLLAVSVLRYDISDVHVNSAGMTVEIRWRFGVREVFNGGFGKTGEVCERGNNRSVTV
ncbi:hypothetical protein HanRHA438_Chr17g0832531 [Helianthus annuus]|nr:hypothetical protein HanRHA438_Chr17g0832531 [Helianthus annuus]